MLGAFLSRHNETEISINFCVFWIPILIFFKKKIVCVHNSTFCILYFKCKCEKTCTFSNILQKVKSNFLPISIILRLIPMESKKIFNWSPISCSMLLLGFIWALLLRFFVQNLFNRYECDIYAEIASAWACYSKPI